MNLKNLDDEQGDHEQEEFDADLPPLVPMEESDVSQLNLGNLPSGSSRPSRQLFRGFGGSSRQTKTQR